MAVLQRRGNRSEKCKAAPMGTLKVLSVDQLIPTPDNKREGITNESVASLAKSIGKHGMLQPLVVRKHPSIDGQWEIRAGERRWKAAKLAGLKHVPAILRVLSDEEALAVTIAENLQRKDPHPLEMAATVQQAIDRGYDLKAIASQVGKSVQTVARLASLTNLSEAWRSEVLLQDSDASLLSVAHLELIARLPKATQDALTEDGCRAVFASGIPTVEQLRRITERDLRTLRSFAWKLDDETLDPQAGSCLKCPKRSGMQPDLFADEDAPDDGKVSKTDRCLDPSCFGRKQALHLERREGELREKHPDLQLVQVGFQGLSEETKSRLGDRVTQTFGHNIVKRDAPDAVPALAVDGPKAGSLIYVRRETNSDDAHSQSKRPKRPLDASGKPMPLTLNERQGRLAKRRAAWLVKAVLEELRTLTTPKCESVARTMQDRTDPTAQRFNSLALLAAFGTMSRADRNDAHAAWDTYKTLLESTSDTLHGAALYELVKVWSQRLARLYPTNVLELAEDARRICCVLGWNWFEFEVNAHRAIPTPKAWAGQVAARAPVPCDEFGVRIGDQADNTAEKVSEEEPEEPPFDANEQPQSSQPTSSDSAKARASSTLTRSSRRKARARRKSKRQRAAA